MKKLLASFLLLLSGCGPESDTIYCDQAFTLEERMLIEQSIDNWNYATNGHANVNIEFVDLSTINTIRASIMVKTSVDDPRWDKKGVAGEYQQRDHDLSMMKEAIILIRSDYPFTREQFIGVVEHEVGHWFGAHHVEDPRAVMYYTMNKKQGNCLTKQDVESYAEAHNLSIDGMHWCLDN